MPESEIGGAEIFLTADVAYSELVPYGTSTKPPLQFEPHFVPGAAAR